MKNKACKYWIKKQGKWEKVDRNTWFKWEGEVAISPSKPKLSFKS